jgi:FixJ family two-component response regulator
VIDAGLPSTATFLFDRDPAAIDLLITDLKMPGMSGQALADRLALTRPDLPILFITGWLEAAHRPELRGPHRRLLAKPFEASALLEETQALLSTIRR